MDLRDGEERKDPRAILAEAFPDGFSHGGARGLHAPPDCYFSWRHWGRFTGATAARAATARSWSCEALGRCTLTAARMLNLRLFFKQRDLFDPAQPRVGTAAAAEPLTRDVTRHAATRGPHRGL
ncbi:hypothetical protein PINS_up024400 [Pythium insidiosum]|nr:hypothetical protein PINS_up024400 [Pythium insidiosum]